MYDTKEKSKLIKTSDIKDLKRKLNCDLQFLNGKRSAEMNLRVR